MGIFSTPQQRVQLLLGDDASAEFRRLPVRSSSLCEVDGEDITRGWPLFNKLLKRFDGGNGLPSGMVQIAFERDIILDPYSQVDPAEKPEKGPGLVKEWIRNVAETARYKHQKRRAVNQIWSKVTLFMGGALILMVLMIGLKLALGGE